MWHDAQDLARDNIIQAQITQKRNYDKKAQSTEYEIGETVLLKENANTGGKFKMRWEGPYVVVEKKNEVNYKIRSEDGKRSFVTHIDRLKKFQGRKENEPEAPKQNETVEKQQDKTIEKNDADNEENTAEIENQHQNTIDIENQNQENTAEINNQEPAETTNENTEETQPTEKQNVEKEPIEEHEEESGEEITEETEEETTGETGEESFEATGEESEEETVKKKNKKKQNAIVKERPKTQYSLRKKINLPARYRN